MYKRVDEEEKEDVIEGFSYLNKEGYEDSISLECSLVRVDDPDVYYEDIPKMIKALQAAYDYHKASKQ